MKAYFNTLRDVTWLLTGLNEMSANNTLSTYGLRVFIRPTWNIVRI